MATQDSESAQDEVLTAVASYLMQHFSPDLFWVSLGLLDEQLVISWKTFINSTHEASRHHCRNADKSLQCSERRDGASNMWCLPNQVVADAEPCELRLRMGDLERATKSDHSHSLGNVSKLLWLLDKDAPYLSRDQNRGITRFKLLGERLDVLKNKKVLPPQCPENYPELSRYCIPPGCNVALAPIVQHRMGVDNVHLGAIVICAGHYSEVWNHLPIARAIAISLLEQRRHLPGIISLKDLKRTDLLTHVLVQDLRRDFNLFQGDCSDSSCPLKRPHRRHDEECRLSNSLYFRDDVDGKPWFQADGREGSSMLLQKSLFSIGSLSEDKFDAYKLRTRPALSHATTLDALVPFLKTVFKVKIGALWETSGRSTKFVWPMRPGVITLRGMVDVYESLQRNEDKNRPTSLDILVNKNGRVTFSFSLNRKLTSKLEKDVKKGGPGATATTIDEVKHLQPTVSLPRYNPDCRKVLDALEGRIKEPRVKSSFPNLDCLELSWDGRPRALGENEAE